MQARPARRRPHRSVDRPEVRSLGCIRDRTAAALRRLLRPEAAPAGTGAAAARARQLPGRVAAAAARTASVPAPPSACRPSTSSRPRTSRTCSGCWPRPTSWSSQPVRDGYHDLPLGHREVLAAAPRGPRPSPCRSSATPPLHPFQVIVRIAAPATPRRAVPRPAHPRRWPPGLRALPHPCRRRASGRCAALSLPSCARARTGTARVPVDDLLEAAGAAAAHTVNHPGNAVLVRPGPAGAASGSARRPSRADPGTHPARQRAGPRVQPAVLDALGLDAADGRAPATGSSTVRPVPDATVVRPSCAGTPTHPEVVRGRAGRGTPRPPRRWPRERRDASWSSARPGTASPGTRSRWHAALRRSRRVRVHLLRRSAIPDVAELPRRLRAAARRRCILHVTDRLFGPTPEEAADAVVRPRRSERPLVVTLHDLPQPSDGARTAARRAAAYRRDGAAAAAGSCQQRPRARLLRASWRRRRRRAAWSRSPVARARTAPAATRRRRPAAARRRRPRLPLPRQGARGRARRADRARRPGVGLAALGAAVGRPRGPGGRADRAGRARLGRRFT